jgi:pimeloyl-[acyl-carrier protein] methyl ester esterase
MREPAAEFKLSAEPMIAGLQIIECFRFDGGVTDRSRAVILLPGYACTGASFARQRPLAADWDLRCLTLPETGSSSRDVVRDLAGVVIAAAAMLDRPALLGTSFSGLVSIDAASRAPELFSAVILVSAFARWPANRVTRAIATALVPVAEVIAWLPGTARMAFVGGPPLDRVAAAELRREARCHPSRERRTRLRGVLHADLRPAAAKIMLPVLVIHGTDDRLVPLPAAQELARVLPNREILEIEGAGHLPYLTHAEDFNRRMNQFLEGVFSS